jgi:AbrB family looped-hinge helix DNA binding protein
MKSTAKLTSKGQITIPVEIRKRFGMRTGDRLTFVDKNDQLQVMREGQESPFAKYQGIGNPGIGSGRDAITRYFRELRGHDEFD